MSSTSSPTLIPEIHARRSEALIAILTIALGGGALLLIEALPLISAVLAAAAIAILLAVGFVRAGWLGRANRIQDLVWTADGEWILTDHQGRRLQATLDGAARVWPHVLWLRWRVETGGGRTRTLLLTRFDVPADELRRLVVRLRLDGSTPHVAAL